MVRPRSTDEYPSRLARARCGGRRRRNGHVRHCGGHARRCGGHARRSGRGGRRRRRRRGGHSRGRLYRLWPLPYRLTRLGIVEVNAPVGRRVLRPVRRQAAILTGWGGRGAAATHFGGREAVGGREDAATAACTATSSAAVGSRGREACGEFGAAGRRRDGGRGASSSRWQRSFGERIERHECLPLEHGDHLFRQLVALGEEGLRVPCGKVRVRELARA